MGAGLYGPDIGIGCDDGRVSKLGPGSWTLLVCVSIARSDGTLAPRGVSVSPLRVDGLDASSLVAHAALQLSRGASSPVLFLDSITIGGFNVVSPPTVYRLAHVPVVVAYTYRPSFERLARAASKLPTYRYIEAILRLADSYSEVKTRRGILYLIAWGLSPREAAEAAEAFQVHSRKPEPVRVAHYIASALSALKRPCSRG